MREEVLQKAKELIKKKKFREALNILFQLWRNDKSPEIAIEILHGLKFHPNKDNTDKWLHVFEDEFASNEEIQKEIKTFKLSVPFPAAYIGVPLRAAKSIPLCNLLYPKIGCFLYPNPEDNLAPLIGVLSNAFFTLLPFSLKYKVAPFEVVYL